MKILLVEDDEPIAKALTGVLTEHHYAVDVATDGEAGWKLAEAFIYDLIMLDVMLPKLDGINLCKRLRSHHYHMPILLLTGQNSSSDKVRGLDAGADDYVIKPFNVQELLARIRVLLRRGAAPLPPILKWENLHLNPNNCEVTYEGNPLNLTPKEYSLLQLFLRNKNRVFSRSAILEHLWSFEDVPNEETVTSHIKGLRQKLKIAGAPADFIETVYGLGYRLKEEASTEAGDRSSKVAQHQSSLASPNPKTRTQKSAGLEQPEKSKVQQQTTAAMAKVWAQFKESVCDRVAVLKKNAKALQENTPDEDLQQKIEREAHKLGGALGMFGFPEGSRLACEVEKILKSSANLERTQIVQLCDLVAALQLEIQKPPAEELQTTVPPHDRSFVLMIDDDADLAKRIKIEAASGGVHFEVATDLSVARDLISREPPDVVLLDLSFPDTAEDGFTLLSELTNRTPPIPVLVLTGRDSFTDRLEVARRGGRAYLQKPVPPAQLLEKITQLLKQINTVEAKVMVVDDDRQMLAEVQTLLKPWGVTLISLSDPRRFWDILAECTPDLLILDLEMPYVSGIDLCQVVRNEPRWGDLPVLFLTDRTDAETVHRLFIAGADDYVSKPLIGPELVTRALSRLERSRYLAATRDAKLGR